MHIIYNRSSNCHPIHIFLLKKIEKMNMEESKATPTLANHDGHCQRCLVAEVEFVESFYERFNNLNSTNMVKVDLDTATAQKKLRGPFPERSGFLYHLSQGFLYSKILKVWSCLCCQELKTGHSCKAAKALRYSKFRHPSAFHIMIMMLAPVLHLFSDHSESSLSSQ